jgi:hypothetical protein
LIGGESSSITAVQSNVQITAVLLICIVSRRQLNRLASSSCAARCNADRLQIEDFQRRAALRGGVYSRSLW